METTITNIKWLVMIGTLMQFLWTLWLVSQINIYLSWVFALFFMIITFRVQRAVVEMEKLKWWAYILVVNMVVMYAVIAIVAYAQWSIAKSGGF